MLARIMINIRNCDLKTLISFLLVRYCHAGRPVGMGPAAAGGAAAVAEPPEGQCGPNLYFAVITLFFVPNFVYCDRTVRSCNVREVPCRHYLPYFLLDVKKLHF